MDAHPLRRGTQTLHVERVVKSGQRKQVQPAARFLAF